MEKSNIKIYTYEDYLKNFGYKPIFKITTNLSNNDLFSLDINFPIMISIEEKNEEVEDSYNEINDENFHFAIKRVYHHLLSLLSDKLNSHDNISFLKRQFLDSIDITYFKNLRKFIDSLKKIDINTNEGIEYFAKKFIDYEHYYTYNICFEKEIKVLEKFKKGDKLYLVKSCFISDLYEPIHELEIVDIECSYYLDKDGLQLPYYYFSYEYENKKYKGSFKTDNSGKIVYKTVNDFIFENKKDAVEYKEKILLSIYLETKKLVNY